MTQNARKMCSILFTATLISLSGSANAQQEFDREKAAKAIADSEMFKDCHIGINNRDASLGLFQSSPLPESRLTGFVAQPPAILTRCCP